MITTYGGYSHDDNETWHTISYRQNYSKVGGKTDQKMRWYIYGVKKAASTAALTTALFAMESAYLLDGQDLTFFDNAGNPTVHSIASANTLNGTRVAGLDYLPGTSSVGGSYGSGTEYNLRRTYRITIEAEILTTEFNITNYHETIKTLGTGGPDNLLMGSLTGPMQLQTTQLITPFYAIQTGTAFGHTDYPDIPAPFEPAFLDGPLTVQTISTPKFGRVLNTEFGIGWTYKFKSAGLLVGSPSNF